MILFMVVTSPMIVDRVLLVMLISMIIENDIDW